MQEGLVQLTKVFERFSEETARLENAYRLLHERFEKVSQELETTNERLHGILEHMAQGILFLDSKGTILTVNPAAEQILGVSRETLLEQPFWNHFENEALGFSMSDCLQLQDTLKPRYLTFSRKDGSKRELEIVLSFVAQRDAAGRGLLFLIRDITEMRNLQLIANRNDRMKELGEMAASVAHEIRNPLGGIKGFAALLHRDLVELPQLQQMAGYIMEGADTLNHLVSSVLHYARPLTLQKEEIDARIVLEEAVSLIKADANLSSHIHFNVRQPAEPLNLLLDRSMIKSALLNLLVNAIQATPQKGEIILELSKKEGKVAISVQDTGIGIPQEHLEKIFSPFFTTKTKGNGLGLAEVYKVVQAHHGTLEVHSESGLGSTFIIKLPEDCHVN